MGVDNDAKLVFGWTFSWNDVRENAVKILQKFDISYEEDRWDEDLQDCFGNLMMEKYNLHFGYASPYFDCSFEDRIYYLSLSKPETPSKEELKTALNKEYNILNDFISSFLSLETPQPEIYLLTHIW